MRSPGALITAVALLVSVEAVRSADEAKAPDNAPKPDPPAARESIILRAARPPVPGVKVWTNADLARLAQGGAWATEVTSAGETVEPEPPLPPAAADPLAWLEDEQEQSRTRAGRLAAAESDVNAALTAVAALEVQRLAVSNPFSARPQLSEEEIEYRRTSGETAAQRAERTEKALEEARARLIAAQARLDRAKAGSK